MGSLASLDPATLQELELRVEAGGPEDADTLASDDDAIFDDDAFDDSFVFVAEVRPPEVPGRSGKKSKTETLAQKSADRKKMREIVGDSGGRSNVHFELPCSLWWKELLDSTRTTEGFVLLPEVDTEPWYVQTFITQGGMSEVPHATELVRVSRIAAESVHGTCHVQKVPAMAENRDAKCQRGTPAMKAIIEKIVQSLPITFGGLLITVPFGGVRDVSLAALSVRADSGYDVRVLEYEAREFFWTVGEERMLEAACAAFNEGKLEFKGAKPLPACNITGSSAPVLRQSVAECRSKMKVLSITDDGLLLVPELSALPEEMKNEDVKSKLTSLQSLAKKYTSLHKSTPCTAEDWTVVVNTELTDVVSRVHVHGLVLPIVGTEQASTKYGAHMGFQNETGDDITVDPGDFVGCGNLEVKHEADVVEVSMPFGFGSRACPGSNATYASAHADGFIKSTVSSALKTVMSTSPTGLLVYGHNATVTSGKVTLTRAEDIFACGGIPDDIDMNNAGVYAIIDAENSKKTSKFFSFLPVYNFSPTCDSSNPTFHLQPLNKSQLIRMFVKKAFTVPTGKTMFPKWA